MILFFQNLYTIMNLEATGDLLDYTNQDAITIARITPLLGRPRLNAILV